MSTEDDAKELKELVSKLVELQGKNHRCIVFDRYMISLRDEFPGSFGDYDSTPIKDDLTDVSAKIDETLEKLEACCLKRGVPLNVVLSIVDGIHSLEKTIPIPPIPKPPI